MKYRKGFVRKTSRIENLQFSKYFHQFVMNFIFQVSDTCKGKVVIFHQLSNESIGKLYRTSYIKEQEEGNTKKKKKKKKKKKTTTTISNLSLR